MEPSRIIVRREQDQNTFALSSQAKGLYRALTERGPLRKDAVDELLTDYGGITALNELAELRLVQETSFGLVTVPRGQVIDDLLTEQALILRHAMEEVLSRQRRLRALIDAGEALEPGQLDGIQPLALHHGDSEPAMYELPSRANRELMALHPGGTFLPDVLKDSLRRAAESLDAGVRLRVVHQSSALTSPAAIEYLQAIEDRGGLVRVRQHLPFRMLIVDRNAAVCAASSEDSGPGAFLVRGARVIALLGRVFETTWVDSVPLQAMLAGHQPESSPGEITSTSENLPLERRYASLSPQQQIILRYLAEGETDRMISRRLGVTSRTVTRRIAEVYEALRVESRFQAGVAANRLGLV
jgi:DNA-binding CsgD family transcriptional regulator